MAVHGTHLRVARNGERVVVDLSEGVVSIGAPPKIGSTYGALVTAPAHVEFEADALATSIIVDHDAASVREAGELRSFAEAVASTSAGSASPASQSARDAREGLSSLRPTPSLLGWTPRPMARSSPVPVTAPNPLADESVASAVRACASSGPHSTDLTITLSSTLTVEVQSDGFARLANFDPPLAPDIQACASQTIYSTRFVSPGPHKISIALQR
jgi:hypothetical protein